MKLSNLKSINFEFFGDDWNDLTALGGIAETYAYSDPQSALVKLRMLAEKIVEGIYQNLGIPKPVQPSFIDSLNNHAFKDIIPKVVLDKLHAIRIHGNKAAHGEQVSSKKSVWLLKEAHDLSRWFFVSHLGGDRSDCQDFQEPQAGGPADESKSRMKQEKRAALEKLAAQEAKLDELLDELEKTRIRANQTEQELADLAGATLKGQLAADALDFDEATTRDRLIDSQLVDVGWNVGPKGINTDEVTREEKVDGQPTETGQGFVDYVLWDDNGKPLAVVEAKKTAVDAEKGRTQARLYADGMEQKSGQRPIIFYTNGFDIWIWDDQAGYPPRKLFGFYSKDSLQYLIFQRQGKKALDSFSPKPEITSRLYQLEAIKQITERFTDNHRKALIVQASGTGKTRLAISLTELLIRAGWVKRILFLCDRRELRKQAKNAYNDFLKEPLVTVGARTAKDRNQRIYVATYPAMMRIFQSFDVGFFDLIFADESHRSIYNVYGDLFRYFDSFQVGLTATPVEFVSRNTYQLYNCENQNPTAYYSFERAVEESYLVPFEVQTYTTDFQRRGIKYAQLTEEQRRQLEEDGEDPKQINYEVREMDRKIYNKDTSRHIIRNLMENGIRDATGQQVGKSIIFARNHEHALLLSRVFDEMYPQYGGNFCYVIDTYDPRAEQLIDDFKQSDNELTIAISVDMLDTGIDVPEVVNLVFAKPIYSKVKFWQMIGRGTRLCPDLLGPGKDKTNFRIFDHWGNFDYFDFHYKHVEPTTPKSLMQMLFEAQIDFAEAALQSAETSAFDIAFNLIALDINRLPDKSIAVREKWRTIQNLSKPDILHRWDPDTVANLRSELAPLMQWVNIRGYTEAHELDLLITRMQIDLLKKSGGFNDYKISLMDKVNSLQMHLNPVREKAEIIKKLRSSSFWKKVTVKDLKWVRTELREIIHHRASGGTPAPQSKTVDIREDTDKIKTAKRTSSIPSVDMKIYERQVEDVLKELFEQEPILKKIRRGKPVSDKELENLSSLILTQNPDVNLDLLKEFYGDAIPLDQILRSIIGMEPDAVRDRFETFVQKHSQFTAKQTRFLSLLQNHIARNGSIELERLYEDPFTLLDADGIDGIFNQDSADELINIINTFSQSPQKEMTQP